MEHDEIAENFEGIKNLLLGSTQCDEKSEYEEQPDHIATQPPLAEAAVGPTSKCRVRT